MKKYLSVFELITRSTLYKVLAILILLLPLQFSMFIAEMHEKINLSYPVLESIVDESYMIIPLGVAFILITIVLCWSGCNFGSKQSYTLMRLQIPEGAVLGLQILYNGLIYTLLWASQVALMVVGGHLHLSKVTEATSQALVLAFYRNDYMHGLLPMEDAIRWLVLLVIIIGCGFSTAMYSFYQRRGKRGWMVFVSVGIGLTLFASGIGEVPILIVFYATILASSILSAIMAVRDERRERDEE